MSNEAELTPERLAKIKERVSRATPGGWDMADGIVPMTHDNGDGPAYLDWKSWNPDTEFICHARSDVPALVAEVERLQARLAERVLIAPARLTRSELDGVKLDGTGGVG